MTAQLHFLEFVLLPCLQPIWFKEVSYMLFPISPYPNNLELAQEYF